MRAHALNEPLLQEVDRELGEVGILTELPILSHGLRESRNWILGFSG